MFDGFTDEAKKVLNYARQNAQNLNHEFIGTENLLLGITEAQDCFAYPILKDFNVDCDKIKEEISKIKPRTTFAATTSLIPFTPRLKKVLGDALNYSKSLHCNNINSLHLLYALLKEKEGTSYGILGNLGIEPSKIEEKVDLFLGGTETTREGSKKISAEAEKDYWRIPRDKMTLEEALARLGYEVSSKRVIPEIFKNNILIGSIRKDGERSIPSIFYDVKTFNNESLDYAFELKKLFDEAGVDYEVNPPRAEIIEELRKRSKELNDLADLLE